MTLMPVSRADLQDFSFEVLHPSRAAPSSDTDSLSPHTRHSVEGLGQCSHNFFAITRKGHVFGIVTFF